jgi:DNA processing protein
MRLARTDNISPRLFFRMIEIFGNAEEALKELPQFLLKSNKKAPIEICSIEKVEQELYELEKIGAKILTFQDKDYPKLFFHVESAPPVLSYKGNKALLNKDSIAIVGARNSSINGETLAKSIASDLSHKAGITVVSGLARGIDAAAHNAALPNTIAVLAGGIDNIYPPQNSALYHKIQEQGLLIAELPIGSKPLTQHFPQRNRLVSGLSLAIVVIEAGKNSGSLITANFALEQGREVFAVPGFPLDPRSKGANKLIKDGAAIVENAADIIENLPQLTQIRNKLQEKNTQQYEILTTEEPLEVSDNERNLILSLLSSTPTHVEDLVFRSKIPIKTVYRILLELELAEQIVRSPGNTISLILA